MAVGSLVWSGSVTIPAAGPEKFGEVEVSQSHADTDIIVATLSHTAVQDLGVRKRDDFSIQVIKDGTANVITFRSNQKQNPQLKVDYIVMGISS